MYLLYIMRAHMEVISSIAAMLCMWNVCTRTATEVHQPLEHLCLGLGSSANLPAEAICRINKYGKVDFIVIDRPEPIEYAMNCINVACAFAAEAGWMATIIRRT